MTFIWVSNVLVTILWRFSSLKKIQSFNLNCETDETQKKKKKKSDIFSKHFAHNLASEITMPYADPEIYDVGFGSRTWPNHETFAIKMKCSFPLSCKKKTKQKQQQKHICKKLSKTQILKCSISTEAVVTHSLVIQFDIQ